MTYKTVAKIGLIICFLYFLTTTTFIISGSQTAILLLEVVTMISGIYMVLFFAALSHPKNGKASILRTLAIASAASCMTLTNVVHWVYIAIINPMVVNGVDVPDYLKIGVWPSVIMAVDYLAWGLFVAIAFLFSAMVVAPETQLKTMLFLCGCLCIVGFLGVILVHESLWLVAPIGYGIGTAIICIKLLFLRKDIV